MPRKKQSRGSCSFCGQNMSKSGIARHLASCEKRLKIIEAADSKPGPAGIFYHLRIEDAWSGSFWLHLEMSGKATLAKLDSYLRSIWLECCGHLSEFSMDRRMQRPIAMSKKAGQVFRVGLELHHIYDFGSSSETRVKVVDVRKGKPITQYPITLMARNDLPEYQCVECGNTAAWLCLECLYEGEGGGVFCDKHAKTHPHDEYGEPVEIVNSPRLGICGYTGPAKPPY